MLSFIKFLIESEDKILYHLNKNPEHADFLNNFLSKNRHTRSKYLDWVTKSLNKSTNAEQLGNVVDFYHQSKQKQGVIPPELKDINKFKSHDDFIDRITNIQNVQPISDKETKYEHPDNKVIYNNKGLKITNIGSHTAAKHIRTCYGGSLCTTEKHSYNYDTYDPRSLHLYEFRDPDSGKIKRYFSGIKNGKREFADLNNKRIELSTLHPKLKELMYYNGPDKFKGEYNIAPPEEKKKIDHQIELAKNPENHEKLLNTYGKDLHPVVQHEMLRTNKNIFPKIIETVGDKLHPDLQKKAMEDEDPSVAHKLIETIGNKMHPFVQQMSIKHKDSSVAKKAIDTLRYNLDPNAQEMSIEHEDPSVADKLIETIGNKMHPFAQQMSMEHKNSSIAKKVIETMGDKLDSYAHEMAMNHEDPSVREKAINLYGTK